MPKPEAMSVLGLYGDKSVFEKRIREGYTEVASGVGDWVDDERIVRLFAFYHPDGRIATYERPKFRPDGLTSSGGSSFEAEYTEAEFQEHLKKFKITLGEKSKLVDIVRNWEE